MGILDFLRKQFVEIIDWVDEPGTLAIRYAMENREIQNGAQLTVRAGQTALLVNEGQLADAFRPGLYTLETGNLPVLTALMNWDKGFSSPFKSDIYFYSQKEQTGLKWGTTQPITVRDKDFGPLRLRAFGSYSFRIESVAVFSVKMMGSLDRLTIADIEPQLRGVIATAIASALGGGEIAFLDLAANQSALSERLKTAVEPAFAEWGLSCRSFFIESLSLPEEVQAHLDKASSMRVVGDLDQFVRFQSASALEAAAAQAGGIAGAGAGMAAGMTIGQTMAQDVAAAIGAPEDAYAQIEKLHRLVASGALTQEEFAGKKAELLSRIR